MQETSDRTVGDRIGVIRQQSGLTQQSFAEALGVSRSLVAQWESGRGGAIPHLSRIAEILKVSEEVFLNGLSTNTAAETISSDEASLLRGYRRLSTSHRIRILKLIHALSNRK